MRDDDIFLHRRPVSRNHGRRDEPRPVARDEDMIFRRRLPRGTPAPTPAPADRSV